MAAAHYLRKVAGSLVIALLAIGAAVELGAAAPWSFAVFGDQRDQGSYGINQVIVEKMAAEIASKNPAFVLCAGDEIHGHSNDTEAPLNVQYTHWKTAMNPILNISYPVRGNHETYGDDNTPGPNYAKHWMDNIANVLTQIPRNGPPTEVGMSYSFSRNNVFIIGLEQSYATNWYRVNQSWLNDQLKANTLPFAFAYGHYPAFAVVHGKSTLADHPSNRDTFWKSLGNSSINIYFAGHTHLYNRAKISIEGGPEIQQIVVGTGGASLEPWDGTYPDSRVIRESHQESNYGYTLVTVDGNKITAVYYIYNSATKTWSAFDTYSFILTSRNFGANDAHQSLDPATLTNYYQGRGWGIGITKIGSGTLTLNPGASPYSYLITVAGGKLKVQGDYSQAPVTVQSGATATLEDAGRVAGVTVESGGLLDGTGTVVGALANAGTVNPGNSPGTLNVVGSYTQSAGGTLTVEVASATNYDRINVTGAPGTATLAGALAPTLLGGYRPRANQVFPGIITATGGVTGRFTPIVNQQLTPTLFWQARYNPTSVDLWVKRHYTDSGLGLSSNQRAGGGMLNGLADTASGDLNQVLNTIDSLSSGSEVANAFQQISPDKAASLATLGFAGANLFRRGLANRITNLRYGGLGGAGGLGGLGSFNLNYSRNSGLMLAYNSSSLAGLITAKKKAEPESPWGLYLDPGLMLGSQKTTINQTGYNFTIAGFTAGADYRVRDDLLVGLATGYSHTGAAFRGSGGSVESNTWPLTAYAAYLPQSFYAYGSLGYALNLFSLERQLSFGDLSRKASSSPTGHQFNAYAEAGYDLKARPVVVTPLVSLAYSSLWVNSFTEGGAGSLNLQLDSQQADSLQTGVGAKIAAPLKRNGVTVVPQVYATYQHEFSNNSRGLDARLSQGGSTFTFQTEQLGRDFAVVGANATIMTRKNFSLQLNYNAEVGRANYSAHNINAGVRWEF